jgi:hypothetical protein
MQELKEFMQDKLDWFKYVVDLALFGFYATPVPFYFALYQGLKLLHSIDKNNAFSESSVRALQKIKYSGIALGVLYGMCMPFVVVFCELDDAPGGIIMGMAIVCAPLIVATFAAVLEKLIQSAVDLKTENDLTV